MSFEGILAYNGIIAADILFVASFCPMSSPLYT